ncbi:MAG: hypothetical protein OER86_09690 [Phycisphaerae bacterium]|nr:hypothetical protein [Phycisphaerae bacterium]
MSTHEASGKGGPVLGLIAVGIILLGSLGGAAWYYLMAGAEQVEVQMSVEPDFLPPPVTSP